MWWSDEVRTEMYDDDGGGYWEPPPPCLRLAPASCCLKLWRRSTGRVLSTRCTVTPATRRTPWPSVVAVGGRSVLEGEPRRQREVTVKLWVGVKGA